MAQLGEAWRGMTLELAQAWRGYALATLGRVGMAQNAFTQLGARGQDAATGVALVLAVGFCLRGTVWLVQRRARFELRLDLRQGQVTVVDVRGLEPERRAVYPADAVATIALEAAPSPSPGPATPTPPSKAASTPKTPAGPPSSKP